MIQLARQGVFWTVQGEGSLIGFPMVFVRLSGCSIGCVHCDTDYRPDTEATTDEIFRLIDRAVPVGFRRPWVWLTGGEPTDQPIAPLVKKLRSTGYYVALATAGRAAIPMVDFLSVSPHGIDGTVQREGDEVKVVPGLNGCPWTALDEIEGWKFTARYLQPMSGDRVGLQQAVEYVKTHPRWRLGIQAHKTWRLP